MKQKREISKVSYRICKSILSSRAASEFRAVKGVIKLSLRGFLGLAFFSINIIAWGNNFSVDYFKDYLLGKRLIRIGIAENCDVISVTSTTKFYLLDSANGRTILNLPRLKTCQIRLKPLNDSSTSAQLEIRADSETKFCNKSVKVVPAEGDGLVMLQRGDSKAFHKYRGYLEIVINKSGKLTVINTLKLDEYLSGVIPLEIGAKSPPEAIAAAIIAARSYALANLGKHGEDPVQGTSQPVRTTMEGGFDLCATIHCQLYGGASKESSLIKAKVDETCGKIMVCDNKPIIAAYHTTCGGLTENCENTWNIKPKEYLVSLMDKPEPSDIDLSSEEVVEIFLKERSTSFCKDGANFRWERSYKPEELEKIFAKTLPIVLKQPELKPGKIRRIEILARSKAGRVQILEIETESGIFQVHKEQIRWLFGSGVLGTGLPSTFFLLETEHNEEGNPVRFKLIGGGWGHGVGMCVSGARGMAKAGYKYEEILKHYYPGAEIYDVNKERSRKSKDEELPEEANP